MNVTLPTLCPIDGAICDRKCGFGAHATVKRANKCVSCETGLIPLVQDGQDWDGKSFYCPTCSPDKSQVITLMPKPKNVIMPEDPADANVCEGCQ